MSLTMAGGGCGGDGSSPTPAPSATPPAPTPSVIHVVTGMELDGFRATSVNAREWIVVDSTSVRQQVPRQAKLVLPPDAGPDAVPLPVLACPDGTTPATTCDGERQVPTEVDETDWVSGERQRLETSGRWIAQPTAYGPAGENLAFFEGVSGSAPTIHVGPGPLFSGTAVVRDGDQLRGVAAVWRTPGAAHEPLDATGFPDGVIPAGSDAAGWIAGNGNGSDADSVPLVWVPEGDDHVLERLPLPVDVGARAGVASGIDDRRIVGWIDEGLDTRAVVWTADRGGFSVELLPPPPDAARCTYAFAISGARIVGECRTSDGEPIATVWTTDQETSVWRVEAQLEPLNDLEAARPIDVSGDLVVGSSHVFGGMASRAVVWRLP